MLWRAVRGLASCSKVQLSRVWHLQLTQHLCSYLRTQRTRKQDSFLCKDVPGGGRVSHLRNQAARAWWLSCPSTLQSSVPVRTVLQQQQVGPIGCGRSWSGAPPWCNDPLLSATGTVRNLGGSQKGGFWPSGKGLSRTALHCQVMDATLRTCRRRFLCSGGLLWMKATHSWRMSPALYSCRVRMSPMRDALNVLCCTLGSRLGPT